jgi:hypothetical protein
MPDVRLARQTRVCVRLSGNQSVHVSFLQPMMSPTRIDCAGIDGARHAKPQRFRLGIRQQLPDIDSADRGR